MQCSLVDVDVLCPCTGVRKNALMVLTHLILNDMMKVKGHIARMAMCLQVHLPYWLFEYALQNTPFLSRTPLSANNIPVCSDPA